MKELWKKYRTWKKERKVWLKENKRHLYPFYLDMLWLSIFIAIAFNSYGQMSMCASVGGYPPASQGNDFFAWRYPCEPIPKENLDIDKLRGNAVLVPLDEVEFPDKEYYLDPSINFSSTTWGK